MRHLIIAGVSLIALLGCASSTTTDRAGSTPWGLLSLTGEHMSLGMDSGWFEHFPEAYFDSVATELPIWRVFQHNEADCPGNAITPERSWEDTWADVMRLRGINDGYRYDCNQSVYRRDA